MKLSHSGPEATPFQQVHIIAGKSHETGQETLRWSSTATKKVIMSLLHPPYGVATLRPEPWIRWWSASISYRSCLLVGVQQISGWLACPGLRTRKSLEYSKA